MLASKGPSVREEEFCMLQQEPMQKLVCDAAHSYVVFLVYMQLNVVEAHATVLNQMGTLLSNHVARGYIAVRHFDLKGVFVGH